jgi:hypothetical protein
MSTFKPSMKARLEAFCASDFPYVCEGKKTVREDGSVSCECGSTTMTPEQFDNFVPFRPSKNKKER